LDERVIAMDDAKEFVLLLGKPGIHCLAIVSFAWFLNSSASDELKDKIRIILKVRPVEPHRIAAALVDLFDWLYSNPWGTRSVAATKRATGAGGAPGAAIQRPLLSFRAAARSLLLTTIVSIAYFIEAADWPPEFHRWPVLAILLNIDLLYMTSVFAFLILFNALSDYVSLFAIRPWLSVSGARPVFALICGTLIGIAVVLLGAALRTAFYYMVYANGYDDTAMTILESIMFSIPALLVFAWLPLLALCIVGFRCLNVLFRLVGLVQWSLKNGNNHPITALGVVAGLATFSIEVIF
jgi:hypothetical protein